MIFATVGTQLPFDRLLRGIDSWAARNKDVKIVAQAGSSRSRFRNTKTVSHLSQGEFQDHIKAARLVVAHAGMGTILSATELGLPVILMPRLAKFGEHRNDHQWDTAKEMARLSNVTIVEDGESLHHALDLARARNFEVPRVQSANSSGELDHLINAIRDFVWDDSESALVNGISNRCEAT